MPEIVGHDERRRSLTGATWRVIAREGIAGATTRGTPGSTPRCTRPGEAHCEWEDALLLDLVWPTGGEPAVGADRSFVRDPDGVMDEFTVDPFEPDAELPDDAVDTGYENAAGIELWLASDLSTAFVVDGNTVEAWPALRGWVCA